MKKPLEVQSESPQICKYSLALKHSFEGVSPFIYSRFLLSVASELEILSKPSSLSLFIRRSEVSASPDLCEYEISTGTLQYSCNRNSNYLSHNQYILIRTKLTETFRNKVKVLFATLIL